MRFEGIHHVAVLVSDYARSRAFYVETLGLPILRENYREDRGDWKLDLKAGEMELELFSAPQAPPRPDRPEALGLRHLAFRVEDVEEAARQPAIWGRATTISSSVLRSRTMLRIRLWKPI